MLSTHEVLGSNPELLWHNYSGGSALAKLFFQNALAKQNSLLKTIQNTKVFPGLVIKPRQSSNKNCLWSNNACISNPKLLFYFTTPIHSHLRGLYWAHQCSWILLRYLWKSTPFLESSSIEASTYVFEIPLFFLIFYQRIYITTSSLLFHTGQYFFLSRSRVLVLVTKNSITDVILPHKFIISRWWGRKKRETLSRKICATVSRYLGREWLSSQVPNIR